MVSAELAENRSKDAVHPEVLSQEAELLEYVGGNRSERPNLCHVMSALGRQVSFGENFESVASRLLVWKRGDARFQFFKSNNAGKETLPGN